MLAPYTVLGIFRNLAMAVRAMDPKADRTVVNKIVTRLAYGAKSVRDIKGNLVPPRELLAIGISMMDEADAIPNLTWRSASLHRDGLLVTFMALCPLRPGAVCEMRVGEHLVVFGETVVVRFSRVEKKKRRIESVPLPQYLTRHFVRYLSHYWPYFLSRSSEQSQALCMSRNGKQIDCNTLSRCVKERIARRTNKRFTAHMFRHSCATFIADVAPEHARMIMAVLGHADAHTANRHYIKSQQHLAITRYQVAIRDLRRSARRSITL
jgi:integrase